MSKPKNPRLLHAGYNDAENPDGGNVTLRDIFAAFAMAGMSSDRLCDRPNIWRARAHDSYKAADAMLAEREKVTKSE